MSDPQSMTPQESLTQHRKTYQKVGFILGPALALLISLLPVPEGITPEGWKVVSLAFWMATWWATEAIPMAGTSLLPLVYLPLSGTFEVADAARPYASSIIFLLLGGFIIAMGMQRWNLHRRIALWILSHFDQKPSALIGGFMIATALLSMWVSNTATTLMMIPIALSVADNIIDDNNPRHPFILAILLAIAYSASIGGMGTIVGTPPNAMMVGYLQENMGIEISFIAWMSLGIPIVMVLLPAAWWVLTRMVFSVDKGLSIEGSDVIQQKRAAMGVISIPEIRVAILFTCIALAWVFRPLLNELSFLTHLNDTVIAILGAILFFAIPSGSEKEKGSFLLDWETAVKLPWGVVLLFGGGLSLAFAISNTGLAAWLGDSLAVLSTAHYLILLGAIVAMIVFLTEITSNTATTAALMPIFGAIAIGGNIDPILLAAPAAIAASCAFMLPVATAPNAIVFSGGQVQVPDMVKAGFRLNLLAIMIISFLSYFLIPVIFLG